MRLEVKKGFEADWLPFFRFCSITQAKKEFFRFFIKLKVGALVAEYFEEFNLSVPSTKKLGYEGDHRLWSHFLAVLSLLLARKNPFTI